MEKTTGSNSTIELQKSEEIKARRESYLENKPETMRSFHRVMNVLENISFVFIIFVFITALVLSFLGKSIPVQAIPAAWLFLPVSVIILWLISSVHTLVLGAFLPSGLLAYVLRDSAVRSPWKTQGFISGRGARILAGGQIFVCLVVGGFFTVFAWAAWTVNWTVLTPMISILGTLIGVAMAISIVVGLIFSIYQKFIKSI